MLVGEPSVNERGAAPPDTVLLLASPGELAGVGRVWGTGGWLPIEAREALDWLTLVRLLGWAATVTRADSEAPLGGRRWLILGCDPTLVPDEAFLRIEAALAGLPLAVLLRAGDPGGAAARLGGAARRPGRVSGRTIDWTGPGGPWSRRCRSEVEAWALDVAPGTEVWARVDGVPMVAARRVGRGVVVTLAFHPSAGRDADGAVTALLRRLLVHAAREPVAWLDLEGTVVLRMDDPGGAQNVHLRGWRHAELDDGAWAAIGQALARREARLSIGYVSGWVDDGDARRGTLTVAGQTVERIAGRTHLSPLVRYEERAEDGPATVHDYSGEFHAIQRLRSEGLADVELHGYTHMHPDQAAWAAAPDRYEAVGWYRELGRGAEAVIATLAEDERPLARAIAALERCFGTRPTTLICPGDEWTAAALARAADLGLQLTSSYYLALRDAGRFCWTQHVCAPYLNEPDARWFDAGLPVVGYFHDRDPALEGPGWVETWLGRWQEAGARRFVDLRELAAAVTRRVWLHAGRDGLQLDVDRTDGPVLVRALRLGIHVPEGILPPQVRTVVDGRTHVLPVETLPGGTGRVLIPAR